ncbi:MAG: hypothetical protein JW881_05650 [Spirochaetales bacterium]|nr:hypothetical protein [Spirochaetales bacterium]
MFFDLIIAVGIIFIGNIVVKNFNAIKSIDGNLLSHLLIVIEFSLSVYLGKTAASFIDDNILKPDSNAGLNTLIPGAIYAIVSIYILFVVWISMPVILNIPGIMTFVAGIIMIVIGAMSGLVVGARKLVKTADTEASPENPKSGKAKGIGKYLNDHTVTRHPCIMLPVMAFLYVFVFIVSIFGSTTGLFALLVIIITFIVSVIAMLLSGAVAAGWIFIYEFIDEKIKIFDVIVRRIIVPLFMAFVLIVWEHIYLVSTITPSSTPDYGHLVFILFFTGIIPLRIVMMFKPPVRIINIILSLLSFGFYFYSLRFLAPG